MFVIFPVKPADWQHALFMLSYYHVNITIRSDGEDAITTYMVVDNDGTTEAQEQLRLAEMCFQMNWHQSNHHRLCPECMPHSDQFDSCGHLTFTKPIISVF
jgi:hypothetical protein